MAYFYSEIFKDKKKNEYYTLEMVKGFLDANNLTPYTAIHEIDVTFYKLNDTPYFKHCWLIIQSAWFFNSHFFGHHQHIDYVNHYIGTGKKLPAEKYKFDYNYLEKKYNDIDTAKKKKKPINGFSLVSQWYYGILFLVCKELHLPTNHFNIVTKDNREYNPITKTSRQLRVLAPFKIIEYDIKSAFPTFLDIEVDSKLKDNVYNNLMASKKITRSEAKILFNKICNSGKYKTEIETKEFFLSCGYSREQCENIIKLTHNSKRKFISFMTEYESFAICDFIANNDLKRGARLHDALLLIDDKVRAKILITKPNCDFGFKELNRPIIKESFSLSKKLLPYAYINGIPQGLNIISKWEEVKPERKGEANGFRFYKLKYSYISAGFNVNNYKADYFTFISLCETMFSTLQYLNNAPANQKQTLFILKNIREKSNFIFNVRALYFKVLKFNYNPKYIKVKNRDFDLTEKLTFKKNIDFLNALNDARKIVNSNNNQSNLLYLLQERILNNDYSYLTETIITGRKNNNLLMYAIVRKFNLLCCGLTRSPRKQVSSYALYTTIIKNVTIKALSLKPQQQNAFMKNCIKKYERELKQYNRLINNRIIVNQLYLILCDVTGLQTELSFIKNNELQNQLKYDLMVMIEGNVFESIEASVTNFNSLFRKQFSNQIPLVTDLSNIFDNDSNNSIFNHTNAEEAFYRGKIFFNEWQKWNDVKIVNPIVNPNLTDIIFEEFDFDE